MISNDVAAWTQARQRMSRTIPPERLEGSTFKALSGLGTRLLIVLAGCLGGGQPSRSLEFGAASAALPA